MNTNTENHQEKFVCIMSLPQEQAFDILRYYEDQGIDYVSLELQREFWIYDVLVPESRMFDIQPFTDSYFANPDLKVYEPNTGVSASPESKDPEDSSDADLNVTASSASVYSGKAAELENVRSSANAFMLIGAVGLVFSVLVFLDVIKLPVNDLMPIVMTAMFGLFLVIGILNHRKISDLEIAASKESSRTEQILNWFRSTYTAADIDSHCQLTESEETNYFKRAEYIKELILLEYTLEDDYIDTLIDPIYSDLFE